ncbi:hypothetical protein BD310DRAFT_82226 [Dichomitus squalens]|uniref:Uncharacterized protein n=1 Tax=Dichomitus squalens TaxID=114155 RepID=A0A4Q9PJL2_9APHY|nr:hypothetical protein BD310DRAFT_82226 [Dichomitus squalens]
MMLRDDRSCCVYIYPALANVSVNSIGPDHVVNPALVLFRRTRSLPTLRDRQPACYPIFTTYPSVPQHPSSTLFVATRRTFIAPT